MLLPCAAAAGSVPLDAVPPPAGLGTAMVDTASLLAWPLQLETSELWLLGVAAIGTVGLLRADTRLYRRLGDLRWTMRSKSIFDYTLHAGDGIVDLAVMGAFAFGDEHARRTSLAGVEALISAGATSVLLKHLFRVTRPEADSDEKEYFRGFRDDAFPSGHTMAAFATAAVIPPSTLRPHRSPTASPRWSGCR